MKILHLAISICLACLSTCFSDRSATGQETLTHTALPGVEVITPPEGRWSIGLGIDRAWPAKWHHASPSSIRVAGDWTIYEGKLSLPAGDWSLRDSVRQLDDGLVECRRRWQWLGNKWLNDVTLSVRWQVAGEAARPFLPGISYYDNPAAQSVDPTRIPVIGTGIGDRGYYEEHRFPMPLTAIELQREGKLYSAAIHSVPSPLRFGHYDDQWWSLGLEHRGDGVELGLLSGPVASNRQTGVIKAKQKEFFPYPDPFLNVPPGSIIEKTFYVEVYPVDRRGNGFRRAVWRSVELFDTFDFGGYPALSDVIQLKFADTVKRWREGDTYAGFDAFPDTRGRRRDWIDLGWAGQSEAAAYPLMLMGEQFNIERATEMAQRSMDFIATTAPFDEQGFAIRFDYAAGNWEPRRNPLSQAQAMNNMLAALRVARGNDSYDVTSWETFLRRAAEFHTRRILDKSWNPVSTNEGFLIAPLVQAYQQFDEPVYLKAARKAADHYGARHLSMDEPYWGGTLDARCEDKEGAWAALQGFLAIYEATDDAKYLDWAGHAADVVVSYVYVWDVPLPSGRLADHAFQSRGWTAVSVQNMHLDVYGVLCAPALWRLGELTNRAEYQKMARLMVVSCGQLVDAEGGQGEQLQQTNYAQHYDVQQLAGVRGDYVESWNVYWISAHFLNAAAQFEEMGVDWSKW